MYIMIFKSDKVESHDQHLTCVFRRVRQYNIRLNPQKCTFAVRVDELLGCYLTKRDIKENPDNCEAVMRMATITKKKEMMKLNGMFTSLGTYILKSTQIA